MLLSLWHFTFWRSFLASVSYADMLGIMRGYWGTKAGWLTECLINQFWQTGFQAFCFCQPHFRIVSNFSGISCWRGLRQVLVSKQNPGSGPCQSNAVFSWPMGITSSDVAAGWIWQSFTLNSLWQRNPGMLEIPLCSHWQGNNFPATLNHFPPAPLVLHKVFFSF